GVAIGLCLADQINANIAACSCLVLDDDRLAQGLGPVIGDQAGGNIGAAAGCVRDNEPHGPFRKGLCQTGCGQNKCHADQQLASRSNPAHCLSPGVILDMVLSYQALLIRHPILIPLVADIMSLYSIYYFLQGYNKNEFQLKSTPEYCNCMDSYSDLGFFVLLARHATLARAAQELGVTPSTVSKRLAALEQRLGVRLMN